MGSILTNADVFDHASLTADLNAQHELDRDAIWFNMFGSDSWDRAFTMRDGILDKELLLNIDLDFEVKPQVDYTAWNPQASVISAEPRWLQTEEMKVDFEFIPMKMARTYLGKYYKASGDQFQMGPYEWLIAEMSRVIKKKLLLNAFYKGVRNAVGTTTADTMNGVNKNIADAIVAGDLTPVATGVLTYANTFDSIEAMCAAHDLSAEWGEEPAILPVSPTIFGWYWRKRREKFPHLVDAFASEASQRVVKVEGFDVVLIKEYGLTGSQRLCITQLKNRLLGADSMAKTNTMEFQREKRKVNGLVDFKLGYNFAYLYDGSVTVNDQA